MVSFGFTLSIPTRWVKGRRAISEEIDWSSQNSSALINLGARIACIVGSGFLGSFLQICHIVFASLMPYDYINTYKSFFSIFHSSQVSICEFQCSLFSSLGKFS